MDTQIIYTIIALVALLAAGTFFSASEMSFAALNRARIKYLADKGNKRAKLVLRVHDRFNEVISTLLICNNAVALATATVSAFFFLSLIGNAGPIISTIVITLIIVVFTDDLPKSMAKQAPEKFAMIAAPVVLALMTVLYPITFLLNKWKTRINNRMLVKKSESDDEAQGFRGEELLYVVEEAKQEGTISEEDTLRISRTIEFNDLLVGDILTSRTNIVGITKSCSFDDMRRAFDEHSYSRLPVFEESLDNIVGIVHIKDFLKCTDNKKLSIDKIITPVVYTAPVTEVPELFKLLQKEKKHMAIVVDEHGGTAGLVTMDDILKQLVGDIWDEHDEVKEDFIPLKDNKYKVYCTADIQKMFEYFGMDDESESSTVGGWIIDILGKIPEKGDNFTYKNLSVTVTKANPKRAEECLIEVLEPQASESE